MATTINDREVLGQQTAAEYAIERNFAARVWAASGPGRSVGMLAEEQAHWANMQIHTGLDVALYLVREDYSDVFKSEYGVRPRWVGFTSLEDAEEGLERLIEAIEDDAVYAQVRKAERAQEKAKRSLVGWASAHAIAKIAKQAAIVAHECRWLNAAAHCGAEGW
jgi:hypothetical protein